MKRTTVFALALALCGCFSFNSADDPKVVYVDGFDLSVTTCGMGRSVRAKTSVDGHPITMSGTSYERGFGTHPESAVVFSSPGGKVVFDAIVGIDDDAKTAGTGHSWGRPQAQFFVWADGRIVWSSGFLQLGQKPVEAHVDLGGAREIILETRGGAEWSAWDASNADWADARFTCYDDAVVRIADDPGMFRQLGILTPDEKKEPQFNYPDIWGVRPGHPVIFRIPVSGVRPMLFSAKELPEGVTLDRDRGILGGVAPKKKGSYDIEVTAVNSEGSATHVVRLAVGDTIALTPPMGWNSWNTLGSRVTGEKTMANALALDRSGLADHGWAYVNIDDWWQMNNTGRRSVGDRKLFFGGREDVVGPARDKNGRIIPNRSFPDMKAIADYIHSFGFKAGIYSSPGPLTCGGCEGSYEHEKQDAESWAEWGFDYVKYDWCSYGDVFKRETSTIDHADSLKMTEAFRKPYLQMKDHLLAQKRDILYSFCQYGIGGVEKWARETGANCWRSWGDLKDSWNWMEAELEGRLGAENYWKYSGPGCWADPDMMIVGQQRSFGSDHPTFLTPNEQYTHVSLWAMVGSPLLIGCDLTKLDRFTRGLLANDMVIGVNQDRLGRIAKRIRHVDGESVWVRELSDGSRAVALVNRSPVARQIKVSFVELGLGSGEHWVRDMWSHQCEGRHSGEYFADVPTHATKLVKVRSVACQKCD